MQSYFRLVFRAPCKVPGIGSVGLLPWSTSPFWTGIRRNASLTTVRGGGCRTCTPIKWPVPPSDAHIKKREAWLRSTAVQARGKRKGIDALRGHLPTVYPTIPSMPSHLPLVHRRDPAWEHNHGDLPSNPPSQISLAASKKPLLPQGSSSVKCFRLGGSQELCLVMEGSSGSYIWLLLWEMQVDTGF